MDDLGRLADENLATTWARIGRVGDGSVHEIGPLQLVASGLPIAFFNGAFLRAPSPDPERTIEGAIAFMAGHGVPWLLWVRERVDDALLAAGRAAGLRDAGGPPGLALVPIPDRVPLPPGLEVDVVSDAAGIDVHIDLVARGFEMPEEVARRIVNPRTLDERDVTIVVGSVAGVPVSTALVSVTGRTAGIYNVATPAEHRRAGYGAALTWAAVAEGARRGCDHATLQASTVGYPVYRAMGFVEIGRYVQLEGPPNGSTPGT